MTTLRSSLLLWLLHLSVAAFAAPDVGTVTLAEGSARLLRASTWYKLAAGVRVEEGDIVTADERALLQIEFAGGTIVSVAGASSFYLMPSTRSAPLLISVPAGWAKFAVKAPGLRIRTVAFDALVTDAILVMHAQAGAAEVFVESGSAGLVELSPAGADGIARDAKRGEYWAKSATGSFTSVARAPKPFVDAMPRPFADPLPVLAAKVKSKPPLVVDHEITYNEAEPWLAGRDRAAFEKRFAGRLRDPAFRKAVEPHVARYPTWDRQLHPEKYAPRDVPAK